jgi:hypothetical protein
MEIKWHLPNGHKFGAIFVQGGKVQRMDATEEALHYLWQYLEAHCFPPLPNLREPVLQQDSQVNLQETHGHPVDTHERIIDWLCQYPKTLSKLVTSFIERRLYDNENKIARTIFFLPNVSASPICLLRLLLRSNVWSTNTWHVVWQCFDVFDVSSQEWHLSCSFLYIEACHQIYKFIDAQKDCHAQKLRLENTKVTPRLLRKSLKVIRDKSTRMVETRRAYDLLSHLLKQADDFFPFLPQLIEKFCLESFSSSSISRQPKPNDILFLTVFLPSLQQPTFDLVVGRLLGLLQEDHRLDRGARLRLQALLIQCLDTHSPLLFHSILSPSCASSLSPHMYPLFIHYQFRMNSAPAIDSVLAAADRVVDRVAYLKAILDYVDTLDRLPSLGFPDSLDWMTFYQQCFHAKLYRPLARFILKFSLLDMTQGTMNDLIEALISIPTNLDFNLKLALVLACHLDLDTVLSPLLSALALSSPCPSLEVILSAITAHLPTHPKLQLFIFHHLSQFTSLLQDATLDDGDDDLCLAILTLFASFISSISTTFSSPSMLPRLPPTLLNKLVHHSNWQIRHALWLYLNQHPLEILTFSLIKSCLFIESDWEVRWLIYKHLFSSSTFTLRSNQNHSLDPDILSMLQKEMAQPIQKWRSPVLAKLDNTGCCCTTPATSRESDSEADTALLNLVDSMKSGHFFLHSCQLMDCYS